MTVGQRSHDARKSPAAGGLQRLNPIDRAMRCADLALRRVRYPGLETQMLVWLDRRVDATSLRMAIARLSHRHPVIASRLVESGEDDDARPYWRLRPGAVCPLREEVVHDDDRQAVLDCAGQLLSTPQELAHCDPLRFHLIHRPGGKDVVLLQYNHVLMDNKATVPLLREIASLSKSEVETAPQVEQGNPILDYLGRFSHDVRRAAALEAVQLQAHALRGRAATLVGPGPEPAGPARLQIATRTMQREETAALRARIIALCGFPSLSMAILASAFRAIGQLGPSSDRGGHFVAGIGVGLDLHAGETPVLGNLTSVIPIRAEREELDNRDALVRMLSAQMRERLATGIDLGALRVTTLFSRRPRYIQWVVEHLLRYGYSLWYAYFGPLDPAGEQLCGARIEEIFYTGPVWSSIGLTLLVNQYRGRLHFQATYDPRVAPPSLADAFLEFVCNDLRV